VLFTRRVLFAFIVLILVNSCAMAQPQLWPPAAGEPSYPIYISLDTWHGMIGFSIAPDSTVLNPEHSELRAERSARQSEIAFEEWGYAEYKWYVGGEQGITGILRALFWPTAGTVEIARYDRLWASRTPQPPADLFKFNLSQEGWRRLRSHLRSTLADDKPIATRGLSAFYPSERAYHLFHNSHHYLAHSLKEAGIPVSTFWAITRSMLAMQLRRAQRLAEKLMTAKRGEIEWLGRRRAHAINENSG
jgi:hypothetical protein